MMISCRSKFGAFSLHSLLFFFYEWPAVGSDSVNIKTQNKTPIIAKSAVKMRRTWLDPVEMARMHTAVRVR